MPKLIRKNQSAFVNGKSITYNVLLAQELVRGYARSSIFSRCIIKVDLHKAFDSLNWEFILEVFKALRFPALFIGWIKRCLTTSKFSISLKVALLVTSRGLEGCDKVTLYRLTCL